MPGIDGAWVSGDLSSQSDPVYLVVLGDLGVEDLDGIFDRCRVALVPIVGARRVELAYFRPADWMARMARGDPFASALLKDRRVELCEFGEEEPQDTDVA